MLRQRNRVRFYGGPGSTGPRFCRACRYCVIPAGERSESWWSRCPECGLTFHGAQPRTTRASARAPWRRRAELGLAACVVLGAIALYALNLEPRRVAGSFTLWRFLGQEYGYDEGLWVWRSREFGRRTYTRDGLVFDIDVQSGVANWVRCTREADGAQIFFVERWLDRPGEWRWRLEVDSPAEAWPERGEPHVLRAFMLTRGSLFGTWTQPRVSWRTTGYSGTCGGGTVVGELRPAPHPGAFRVAGSEADLFWAIFQAYDLETSDPSRIPARSDGTRPFAATPRVWWIAGAQRLPTSVDHRARSVW